MMLCCMDAWAHLKSDVFKMALCWMDAWAHLSRVGLAVCSSCSYRLIRLGTDHFTATHHLFGQEIPFAILDCPNEVYNDFVVPCIARFALFWSIWRSCLTLSRGDCLRHLLTTCSCVAPNERRLQLLYSFMYDIKVMLLKQLPYMANMWKFSIMPWLDSGPSFWYQ